MSVVSLPPLAPITSLSVAAFGATGDGVTDDRANIALALAAAMAAGKDLYFPAGVYRMSKYLDIYGASNMRITWS